MWSAIMRRKERNYPDADTRHMNRLADHADKVTARQRELMDQGVERWKAYSQAQRELADEYRELFRRRYREKFGASEEEARRAYP